MATPPRSSRPLTSTVIRVTRSMPTSTPNNSPPSSAPSQTISHGHHSLISFTPSSALAPTSDIALPFPSTTATVTYSSTKKASLFGMRHGNTSAPSLPSSDSHHHNNNMGNPSLPTISHPLVPSSTGPSFVGLLGASGANGTTTACSPSTTTIGFAISSSAPGSPRASNNGNLSTNQNSRQMLVVRDKDYLIEEIMFLKKALTELSHHFRLHKVYTTVLQEDNRKLGRDARDLGRQRINDSPNNAESIQLRSLLQEMKVKLAELQATCDCQHEELNQLHRDICDSRLRDLDNERDGIKDEIVKLRKFIRRLSSYHKRMNSEHEELSRIKERNACLEHAVKRFGDSLAIVTEKLEKGANELALQRSKATEAMMQFRRCEKKCKDAGDCAGLLEELLEREKAERHKLEEKLANIEHQLKGKKHGGGLHHFQHDTLGNAEDDRKEYNKKKKAGKRWGPGFLHINRWHGKKEEKEISALGSGKENRKGGKKSSHGSHAQLTNKPKVSTSSNDSRLSNSEKLVSSRSLVPHNRPTSQDGLIGDGDIAVSTSYESLLKFLHRFGGDSGRSAKVLPASQSNAPVSSPNSKPANSPKSPISPKSPQNPKSPRSPKASPTIQEIS